MPTDPPQVDEQIAMMQEWYHEVLKNCAYFEATNCDGFLTVYMRGTNVTNS